MESGGHGNYPIQKDGVFSRRELPFCAGKFPDAAGTSQFKKMESFSAGNFPIQMDGFFLRWELPAASGCLRRRQAELGRDNRAISRYLIPLKLIWAG
jgi:hypothetical protein